MLLGVVLLTPARSAGEQSPVEELRRQAALFSRLQQLGDLVLVGQRGAGSSQPQMDCDTHGLLPLERVPSRAEIIADARRRPLYC